MDEITRQEAVMDTDNLAGGTVGTHTNGAVGTDAWISIALTCAVIMAVYFAYERWWKPVPARQAAATAPTPTVEALASRTEMVVSFAALVRVPEAPGLDVRPEKAAELFSGAAMRWAGPVEAWNAVVKRMGLTSDSELPVPAAGEDVILAYTGLMEDGVIPDDRVAMRASLRRLAEAGQLTFDRMHVRPRPLNPSRFGFKIG